MRSLRVLYHNSCNSLTHTQAYTSLPNSHTTDYAYEISSANVRIGKGVTREVGKDLVNRGVKRVLLFTDKNLMQHLPFSATEQSLRAENIQFDVYSEVRVEPTDRSMKAAIHRAQLGQYDAFLAVGGGSVMDTAKLARLFDTYRDGQLEDFIPGPLGQCETISRPLKPLICIPTTSGSGSEMSPDAIFDLTAENVKRSISDDSLCPTLAIVDAMNTFSMPRSVATYTGLDVLCQALEAYTANPYTMRFPLPTNPRQRQGNQGSTPFSDITVVHALRLIQMYFLRSVESSEDTEAKSQMSLATIIKGIGFGRAGVHLCHALSYSISCQVKDYELEGYPKEFPIIPHGLSVIITAPAVFTEVGYVLPQRCIQLAQLLGAKTGSVGRTDAGRCLSDQLCSYMKRLGVPNGLSALGFTEEDIPNLVEKTLSQKRLTSLSPIPVSETLLEGILTKSLTIYH